MWHLSHNNNYFFNADQPRDTLFNTSVPAASNIVDPMHTATNSTITSGRTGEIGMFVYAQHAMNMQINMAYSYRFYIIILHSEVGIVPVVCQSCEYFVNDHHLPFFGIKQLF